MNWINSTIVKLIFRHGLGILGTYLVTKGIFDDATWNNVLGALGILSAVGLSVWNKRALIVADLKGLLDEGAVKLLCLALLLCLILPALLLSG